jgi:ACS family glucarate transporter-like MFS transporter
MNSKTHRARIVLLLMSMMFVNAIDRGSLAVAAPLIIKDLHIDAALMGLALSAFYWTYTLFNLPVGRLADRLGAKITLGCSVALWSLMSAATGLVHNWFTLLCARLGVGTGESAGNIVGTKVIVDNFQSEDRAAATAWYLSGTKLGMAAVSVLMGFLISYWNWRAAFVITGLGSLLWCVVWHYVFQDVSRTETKGSVRSQAPIPWKQLLTNRCTVALMVVKFCQDYIFILFVTWVPGYLVMERHFTILRMGVYAAIPWIVGFVSQPAMGHFSDWLIHKGVSVTRARKLSLVGCQVTGATVIAVGFIDDPLLAVYLLTVNIAAESAAAGIMWTILAEVSPRNMGGSVPGAINTIGSLAGIFAPTITGFFFKFTGSFRGALAVAGIGQLISALLLLFVVPAIKPIELTAVAPEQARVAANHEGCKS